MSFLSQPLQSILIRPKRQIDDIAVQVVTSEQTTDTLTITKQPLQVGASATDHAYMEPASFTHSIYFQDNLSTSLAKIYQKLLDLQSSAEPFVIITPKRIYKSMLMATLTQTTDKLTENCLAIHASYQQIILVPIQSATVPRIQQRNPGRTGKTESGGQKSGLFKGAGDQNASQVAQKLFGGG